MLLRQMAVVVEKHTDIDVLEQASMTYSVLCDGDYTIADKAQIERQAVVDSWMESFTLALDIFKEAVSEGYRHKSRILFHHSHLSFFVTEYVLM